MQISNGFWCILALFIYLQGLKTTFFLIASCLIHEFGHIVMMYLLGLKISSITISHKGFKIVCQGLPYLSNLKQILVFLCGPLVNLILYYITQKIALIGFHSYDLFTLSAINFFLMCFNLLPMKLLDGGQILSLILSSIIKNVKTHFFIMNFISLFTKISLLILGAIFLIKNHNFSLILIAIFLLKN